MTIDDLSRHMGVIQLALTHLLPRLQDLMTNAICNKGAGAVEVGRTAGRLEQVLSEFVDGYLDAKASHAGPDGRVARTLILGVYRHHIREICDWLDELVEAITHPASAIQKRGIAMSANLELTVVLNMTIPQEMAKLHALVKKLLYLTETINETAPRFEQPNTSEPGILGRIGALSFGIGVTDAVFG
ncbi:MAG: hypothetical protein U1D36_16375 [Hydrogenophaga sp.]|uniref:hypothetical protein n=1 Tax=Hydrogenophaga sp. TaxID=1904254 RepID=UPI0027308B0F|nr:hypothetical protein [Hydrogenophaga sp.]MDP2405097.1 hypothetical protein [Hydrogenophaga sp.]MDZ4176031.1 hypothetical protein [Hydrogenophaga sp.]